MRLRAAKGIIYSYCNAFQDLAEIVLGVDPEIRLGLKRSAPSSKLPNDQFARYLDNGMFARGTDVLARFEALFGESLALGNADAFDRRLIVVGSQVARDRLRSNLLGEKTQP